MLETVGGIVVLGQGPVDALYGAAKTLATVDPNKDVDAGPKAFKVLVTTRSSSLSSWKRASPPASSTA